MRKRINSIDILRMVAAFFIVVTHYTSSFAYSDINCIYRFAVPVFFVISGYFYFAPKEKKKVRIKKIFSLTVITNIAFFLFYMVLSLKDAGIIDYLTNTFTVEKAVNFIFFNSSPFSEHLWFLSALLYCMIIDYFLSDFLMKHKKLCIVMIVTLLLCDLIFGKYSLALFNTEFDIVYLRNFLFFGIPYFYIGKLFNSADINKIKLNNISLIILVALFCATSAVEKYTLMYFNLDAVREQYLSTTLLTVTIFILTLKNPLENPGKLSGYLAYSGRKYTLAIYIIHPVLIFALNFVAKRLGITMNVFYSLASCLLLFIASWLVAIVYYRIKDRLIKPKITKR